MRRGIYTLIVVGAVVTALGLVAPAYGKIAVPEGYVPAADEPAAYSPQALRALGARGEAMAAFYGSTVSGLRDAHQRQVEPTLVTLNQRGLETLASLDATQGQVGRADDFVPPRTGTTVVASGDSVDWNRVGIGIGIALLLAGLGGAALTMRTRERVAHP